MFQFNLNPSKVFNSASKKEAGWRWSHLAELTTIATRVSPYLLLGNIKRPPHLSRPYEYAQPPRRAG